MTGYIFIYDSEPISSSRDELEERIEFLLGSRGEVTGGGAGADGWNIDVELVDVRDLAVFERELVKLLRQWPLSNRAWLVVNGARRSLFSG